MPRSTWTNWTRSASLDGLVLNSRERLAKSNYILNNSFGMLGINSVVIIGRFT